MHRKANCLTVNRFRPPLNTTMSTILTGARCVCYYPPTPMFPNPQHPTILLTGSPTPEKHSLLVVNNNLLFPLEFIVIKKALILTEMPKFMDKNPKILANALDSMTRLILMSQKYPMNKNLWSCLTWFTLNMILSGSQPTMSDLLLASI